MRCLCCQIETPAANLNKFDILLLCPGCFAIAESQRVQIDVALERARINALQWVVTRLAHGIPLLEGSGIDGAGLPT
jgi:hypothetical protein